MSKNFTDKIKKKVENNFIFKVFFWEALLFFLTLVLGIFSAWKINRVFKTQSVSFTKISLFDFLLIFFLFTIFFLFLVYFKKGQGKERGKNIIFKAIFIFSIFFGGEIILSSLTGSFLISVVLMGFLVFLWYKIPLIFIHDLVIILGIAGAGVILGLSLEPKIVVLLLIIFSIYDFLAVYVTKHMVKMAEEMIKQKVIIGLIFPLNAPDFKENVEKFQPGEKFMVLGGGDVIFPLLLCVSLVPFGIKYSFLIAIFSLIGLFFSFYFFIKQPFAKIKEERRKPIPALPPIAFFSIIGYLITRLI